MQDRFPSKTQSFPEGKFAPCGEQVTDHFEAVLLAVIFEYVYVTN